MPTLCIEQWQQIVKILETGVEGNAGNTVFKGSCSNDRGSVWIAVCRGQKAFHEKDNDFIQ